MDSDSTSKFRRHQLAQTVKGEGHPAFRDLSSSCSWRPCQHWEGSSLAEALLCGCRQFTAGKRVP